MVLVKQQFSILIDGKLVQIRRIHTLMHPVDLAALQAFQFLLVVVWDAHFHGFRQSKQNIDHPDRILDYSLYASISIQNNV